MAKWFGAHYNQEIRISSADEIVIIIIINLGLLFFLFPLQKAENVWTVLHQTESLALVMLCQIRLCPRRLAVHILREVKMLLKALITPDSDEPVIDVIDKCCPQIIEKCLSKFFLIIRSIFVDCSKVYNGTVRYGHTFLTDRNYQLGGWFL